ncbi:MAG TPA: helix-turn-helix domain-containing protein [Tepidisphaeraceae bacterium]|nr:helix-turn-helix domain-containing protein [Tepidisphaeraceae bacterium]
MSVQESPSPSVASRAHATAILCESFARVFSTAASAPVDSPAQNPPAGPAAPEALPAAFAELSAAQTLALSALTAGRSATAAARKAGVSRMTIYRWQTHNPRFIATLNAGRRQALASARRRLLAMSDDAVTAVESSLFTEGGRPAFDLLGLLGVLVPVRPGSDDPAIIEAELAQGALRGAPPAGREAAIS